MYVQQNIVVPGGGLAQNASLTVSDVSIVNTFAFGALIADGNNLWSSPRDFTANIEGDNGLTITWLRAAPLAAGSYSLYMPDAASSSAAQLQEMLRRYSDPTAPESVTSGSPTFKTATIASGQSLSDANQVMGKVVGIITPIAWTAASMTFQGSHDGTTYVDLYDDGVERAIASANIPTAASRMLSLDLNDWLCVNYLKVRSGPGAGVVAQGAARSIILVLAG